jgi:hypothetical protein
MEKLAKLGTLPQGRLGDGRQRLGRQRRRGALIIASEAA